MTAIEHLQQGWYFVKCEYAYTNWTPAWYQPHTNDWWVQDIQFDWEDLIEVDTTRLLTPDENNS